MVVELNCYSGALFLEAAVEIVVVVAAVIAVEAAKSLQEV